MEKIIALTLVLVMCLGLTACGASEDEKKFEEANALLEAGNYEDALEAFSSIELYNLTAEKIFEIEEKLQADKVSFLTGTWKDLKGETTVTFGEAGEYVVNTTYGDSWDGKAWYDEEGALYILDATTVQEIDGVTHLVSEHYDLVSEADFEKVGAKTVEITMDNWADYFEIRETNYVYSNAFQEIEHMGFGFGVFLKDEFAEKLVDTYSSVDVSFKVAYDEVMHEATGSSQNGDLQVGEVGHPRWYSDEITRSDAVGQVWLQEGEDMEASDSYGYYCTTFTGYTTYQDEKESYVTVFENPEVLNVTGTLKLFP